MPSRKIKNFPIGRCVFDYETTGLDVYQSAKPFLLGLEDERGQVLLARPNTPEWALAHKVLSDPKVEKIGYNAKFDVGVSEASGNPVRGIVHDAMLLVFMNNEYEPNLKLKDVAARQLDMPADEETAVKKTLAKLGREFRKEKKGREPNYSDLPDELVEPYLEGDLDRTMKLFWKHEHVIKGPQRRVYQIERELIPNVVAMEKRGVLLDVPYCKKISKHLLPRMEELEKLMTEMAGIRFDFSSPPQLTTIMQSLGLDTGAVNKNGTMNTGANYMKPLQGKPFVDLLMEWRSLHKLEGTYFQPMVEKQSGGVVHPSFWPFGQDEGIKTGRFSMSNPNLQNIPAGQRKDNVAMKTDAGMVRRAFIPRPGYVFLFADYSQIEFVIFGCNSGDGRLLEKLRDGVDFHLATAHFLFGSDCMEGKTPEEQKRIRFKAKELNFSFMYGMGIRKFALRNNSSLQEAREAKNRYFRELPMARQFLMTSQVDLLRDGYVQDQFGRRYHVPRERCYKSANALCQGPAALVMKRGINRVFKNFVGLDAHPILTIHDELICEVRKDQVWDAAHALQEGMEDRENFPIPITVEMAVGEASWADKKNWKEVKDIWKSKRRK
jgi:DNA polymerase-1